MHSRFAPVSRTPFGRPVVPPVPTIIARSPRVLSPLPSSDPVDRSRAHFELSYGSLDGEPAARNSSHVSAHSSVPSRQTSVVRAGSSSRILATSPAYDAWKTSARQPNRSSSSRFSVASFRGLMGHHTAPTRLIPNTVVNATGSLADRIATVSRGPTPWLASAAATRMLSCWTSAYVLVSRSVVRQGASGPRDAPLSR